MPRWVSHHGLMGFLMGLRNRNCELVPKFVPEIDGSFGLPTGSLNAVTDVLDLLLLIITAAQAVEELLEGDLDFADLGVAQAALGDELDVESEAVVEQSGVVESELDGVVVPLRVCAAVFGDGGLGRLLLVAGVAGDRNGGVDVHLGEHIDILEVAG